MHKFKKTLVFALALIATTAAFAQKNYFQQEVNYTIKVALDDAQHLLTGNISFEYINHSPDQLNEIWIHLWPNAFKNRRSAFCRQKLRQGDAEFYFSKEDALGSIKSLDFTVNGTKATWQYDPKNPDIARIALEKPLLPEGSITIATPFKVKVPASFSRLGHVETSYQVTQWYPKPAVYDRDGWHPMPYLDQGEFYSEFGNFDVEITLPDNYVVGATGALQTPSEWAFLAQKEAETKLALASLGTEKAVKKDKKGVEPDSFPASSSTTKTLRYTAQKVHDFAWFADKRFYVLRDTAHLASGKTVDCWGMFTKSDFKHWKKSAFYVKRAVEFYSEQVGEYPWPQATAVHSALSAGGGMEYPMVTVIGNSGSAKSLDEVITHEVGHNWFYGVLASNERDHPWMDEGMNSYYEQRYMHTYYGSGSMTDDIPKKFYDPAKNGDLMAMGLLLLSRNGEDTPGDINSDQMTNIAYGLQAYMKTANCLRWLQKSVGTQDFDSAMQRYYGEWRFKHPKPNDFAAAMQQSGIKIDWFMEQMQTRKHTDPAIVRAKKDADGSTDLTLKQKGKNNAPFSITAFKDGKELEVHWVTLAPGQKTYNMGMVDADAYILNYAGEGLDYRTSNNYLKTTGLFKRALPPSVGLLKPFEQKGKRTLGVLPWMGWNNSDKGMLGLLLYNPPLPGQAVQYYLAPGFAVGSNALVGGGDIRWRIHPTGGWIKRFTIGINGRTFHDDEFEQEQGAYQTRYYRVTPMAKIEFRSYNTAHRQSITARWNYIGLEGKYLTNGTEEPYLNTSIWETKYQFANMALPNPFELNIITEGQNWTDASAAQRYLRLGLEWKQQMYYAEKRKVSVRVYGGYFLTNTNRDRKSIGFDGNDFIARGTLSLAQNGYTDYKRDYLYFNRNGNSGLASRQVQLGEGGFKYAFGDAYSTTGDVGHSNNYIFALNLEADLPKRLPLGLPVKPYFDLGYADMGYLPSGGTQPSNLFWSGGFQLSFLKGYFNIYFPAVNSDNLNRLYKESSNGNYLRRITWSIKMDGLEPFNIADRFLK